MDNEQTPPLRTPSRRLSDLSVLAPAIGLLLLTPSMIALFAQDISVLGAPLLLVYLFSVWLGMIVVAALLSRSLRRTEPPRSPQP